jgi:hypothetical protein
MAYRPLTAFKKFLRKERGLKEHEPIYLSAIEITENFCERFLQYLLDNLSGETPGDYFMRFKRVIKAAFKEGYFRVNPSADVKTKQHPSGIKDVLTIDEYLILVNSFTSDASGIMLPGKHRQEQDWHLMAAR